MLLLRLLEEAGRTGGPSAVAGRIQPRTRHWVNLAPTLLLTECSGVPWLAACPACFPKTMGSWVLGPALLPFPTFVLLTAVNG